MQKPTFSICDYEPYLPIHKERFAALNREWLERYFRVEAQDEISFANPEATVLNKGGIILMVSAGNEIVGTGSLLAMEEATYEIAKMAVTDTWQGRGIGETLLLALIRRAKEKNAKKLFIISNTSLERAIRLYRRHGFSNSLENRHAHYERGNITLELNL